MGAASCRLTRTRKELQYEGRLENFRMPQMQGSGAVVGTEGPRF
jgi:hypothetical protein